jgi:hypothetical protein
VKVSLKLTLPPSATARKLTVSKATGEGFEAVKKDVAIPPNQSEHTETVNIEPLTAISITIE